MEHSICIDWLQLYCLAPMKKIKNGGLGEMIPDIFSKNKIFEVVKMDYQIRQFKDVYEIKQNGEVAAVITANPPGKSVLKAETAIVKIHNKFLYQQNLKDFVTLLLSDLNLTFMSISRIDIAVDFIRFDNGMKGNDLIKKFVNEDVIKAGRSTKWSLNGDTGKDDQDVSFLNFHYLRFGKKGGDIAYYLYNKSVELAQVKEKPYIREYWAANGYEESQGDVWRLEFALKSGKHGIVDDDENGGGETLTMKDLALLEPINFTKWFVNYFDRHFRFYENNGKSRKDRNADIVLFENLKPTTIRIELSKKKDSGRSERIFARKLDEISQELRDDVPTLGMMAEDLVRFYVQQYSLEKWAKQKLKTTGEYTAPAWAEYYNIKCLERSERETPKWIMNKFVDDMETNRKPRPVSNQELTLWGIKLGTTNIEEAPF